MPEDVIAALVGDWSEFSEKERLAFGLARKLTLQPYLVGRDDIAALQKHYSDQQILGMIASIGGFNAMTRWTDGLAIPQEKSRSYLTPASPKYKDRPSQITVAPDDQGLLPALVRRPAPATRAEIDKALEDARRQTPWLALASAEDARKFMPEAVAMGPTPNWVRLFAVSPSSQGRIKGEYALRDKGNLEPKLRAQIDWIAAHLDRAWYALGHAEQRLVALGESTERIAALAGAWDSFTDQERAVFRLVRVSTVKPMAVSDDDFTELHKHYKHAQIAEIMHRICETAYFNRVTHATQLPLEK